jgi:AcrR family transcriptional regulator
VRWASVAGEMGELPAGAAPAPQRRPRGRPRKSPDERDEGNRRQQLIQAAAALFRSKGFAATSTRDIAAAAGMQSGSPFYHFKSKGALLYQVMEQGMRSALRQQAQTLQGLQPTSADGISLSAISADSMLHALIRTHFDILLGPQSDFIPVMLHEWRSLTPEQRKAIVALQHDYEAHWIAVLQSLQDAGRLQSDPRLARLLILGALNWSVNWYDARQGASLDQLSDAAMRLFVRPASD